MGTYERHAPDLDAYHERARTGPCFVCGILRGDPDFAGHHVVYEDEYAVAFLNRWPTQNGYTFVVPLPPGMPYDEQQFAALMLETAGALDIPEHEKADLAARIGRRMESTL